jgi:hypothetical protein
MTKILQHGGGIRQNEAVVVDRDDNERAAIRYRIAC